MAASTRAVFLSYASQDAEVARRIAEALRTAGIEVWLDQRELRGGDAWDAKIRGQIHDCTLFIPIISANTQARREAYFRLEWKLAEERTHLMAKGTPFLVPVVIDDTNDRGALVPDAFLAVQWTRLPGGEAGGAFVERVTVLLRSETRERFDGGRRAADETLTRFATGRTRRRWLTGVVVLAAAAAWFAWPRSAPPPAISAKSIAVLPFTNMSENKENAYFADGMQEDILTNLALVGDLDVISRTSVMGYRDTKKSMAQIGRELGVAFILEGSVRRAGNKVRITGQLINARTDQHLWARSYDRELNDVFAIQSALAKDIAAALHAVLTPQELARLESRPTDNVEAYDLYLQGRAAFHGDSETAEGLARAESLLGRAVQLDPRFALAWVDLADVHLNVYGYREHTDARLTLAKAAIENALQLAPDAPEVILGMATYLRVIGDGAGSNAQVQRLIQAHPNHPATLMLLAWQAPSAPQAVVYFERARRLDPRNPQLLENMSGHYLGGRRYDEALAAAAEANALLPPSTLRSFSLAMIPFQARGATGPVATFLAQLSPEARRTDPNAIMASALWAYTSGDAAGLIRLWEESGANWRFAPRTGRLDTIVVAQALIALGDVARGRALLEKNRDQLMAGFGNEPNNGRKWADLALIHAMLGNTPASQEAEQRARQLTPWIHFASTLAWRGDKDAALAELAQRIPGSGDIHETNVHELRRSLGFWPLWDDPRFQALLDDPKNNAPRW